MQNLDLCLFAHFDKDDKVDDCVLRYLEKINEAGFAVIFITTCRLADSWVTLLRGRCHDVILRENNGFDFASWSLGFAKHCNRQGGRLLLANDSVYGPIGGLAATLKRLTCKPADFYGMVESMEAAPHLQSWFLLFEPWVARHEVIREFMAQPFGKMNKKQVIACGEIALSRRLVAEGFRYEALCRKDILGELPARHAINPMLVAWREVLFKQGVPFLKIELLRDNPLGVEGDDTILRAVDRIEGGWSGIIKSHLTRTRDIVAVRRARRPFLARLCYALIRKRYQMQCENRNGEAALATVLLELLTAPIAIWRVWQQFRSVLQRSKQVIAISLIALAMGQQVRGVPQLNYGIQTPRRRVSLLPGGSNQGLPQIDFASDVVSVT